MSSLKAFFTNERTRFITGLIRSCLTIYIGLSLISFFFTGAADQSKIENIPVSDLVANRGTVENWTGVRGAYLSDLLMNRWFGVSSFMILFFLGVYGMVLSKNYMKKLMAMNVMQVAVLFFYLCFAQKDGAMIPIQNGITTDPNAYINPLPHGLMLTAIVVSLGTTGVAIALLMRIKEIYGSVEEVEVLRRASK